MSNSSYNFKDNLAIQNNRYLKWLDKTGTSRANIVVLDDNDNLKINGGFGDIYINSTSGNSATLLNANGNMGNVVIGTKLGVGFNSTSNIGADVTLKKGGFIGTDSTLGSRNGFLGISAADALTNDAGSRILLYGNDYTNGNSGKLEFFTGYTTSGNFNVYTENDSLKFQILQNGTLNVMPDGVTSRLVINDVLSTVTNDLVISSTTESYNASSGALQIKGGIGISGNLYVDGTISLNSATGNINFDSTQLSTSYTTGAIFLSGGLAISTTVNASSHTSGGALSIAGGAAIGKSVYIGGKLYVMDTSIPTSSQTGSVVLYGGVGVNGSVYLRTNDSSQIKLAPMTDGNETSITFYSKNNFTQTSDSGSLWKFGQNVNSIGSGNFSINNSAFGDTITILYNGQTTINGNTIISNTENATTENNGGALTVSGGASFKKDVFVGGTITLGSGVVLGGTGGSSIGGSFDYSNLSLSATEQSINYSSGTLIVNGGITIKCSADSSSITNGGSFLIAGGASIGKNLYIGGPSLQIPYGTINDRPSVAQTGFIRFNTTNNEFEGYNSSTWGSLGGGVVDKGQTTKILAEFSSGSDDRNLRFITNDIERMRINSVGNIGIGTSSPGYIVDILGDSRVQGKFITSNGIDSYGDSNTLGSVFTTNGNVGIGISSPSYKLDVNGSTHISADLVVNGNISGGDQSSSTFSYLTLTSTDESINLSTGSLVTFGGVTIQCDTNATSVTNGGSFLSSGGMSIVKSVYVGENLSVNQRVSGDNVYISSTTNASGIGTGGSITVLGGASFSKDVFVGGTITSSSDIRLKENIKPFKNEKESYLAKIDDIRTIKYNYINDTSLTKHIGFIAQDFESICPELLRRPDDHGYYTFDYQKMTVILLECIKELKEQIKEIRKN
jgi:hypothetical protein